MKQTSPLTIVFAVILGAAVGWLLEVGLVSSGAAVLVTPPFFAAVVLIFAVAIIAVAVPVRRVAKRVPGAKVDPFYATRVVVLAQAAAITGALLSGSTLGMLVFLLTRPVIAGSTVLPAVLGAAASIALAVASIIAEWMCRVPPDADDGSEGAATIDDRSPHD